MPAPPFGLHYPIAQAPTGSIAGPELAAAVSAAGALGAMALTWTPPEIAAEQVRQVRAATDRPFLVNFALAFPPASLSAALDAGAPIVSFSWGDPAPYVSMARSAGALIGMQVTSAAGAR
ncbi:MAG TPA: nitronate monooxygenase, partial [Chthonomonadaceae bacterium]|nr:nitronate monooxygenase [Chthonomonadaceae bacterium]